MEFISTLLSTLAAVGAALTMFVGNIVATYTPGDTVVSIAPHVQPAHSAPPQTAPAEASNTPAVQTTAPSSAPAGSSSAAKQVATSSAATPTPAPEVLAAELNSQARGALVNILCLTNGGNVHPISGSGVFVDARGVVLTNAHVGQYFLLKDYPTKNDVECTLRTGSPAEDAYRATLLYLPPAWIEANGSKITDEGAKGTGENDYAFLLVTETASGKGSLPSTFPSLSMTLDEPALDENTFLAAYPAGFLDGLSIENNLYATTAYAAVTKLFTFGTGKSVDLVSIGGTVVSQGGSSGGATVRASDGRLQGIIATATAADTTALRDLRTITLAHINRSLAQYGKGGIGGLLSQNLTQEAADFESSSAPAERAVLIGALKAH